MGIKCIDGIVLGADGAATLGVLGQKTTIQPAKKLSFVKPDRIVGVSGPVGFSQRMADIFSSTTFTNHSVASVMSSLRTSLWDKLLKGEFEVAAITGRVFPNMAQECLSGCVLAMPVGQSLELIQFDQKGHPEAATDDLPFVAIGSGQGIADPFLAFIRRIFWEKKKPTISDGIFAAWWTLHHAITTSPGGVADPKQITVLESKQAAAANPTSGKKGVPSSFVASARELSVDELQETEEAVKRAEAHLRAFDRTSTASISNSPVPSIPQPQ